MATARTRTGLASNSRAVMLAAVLLSAFAAGIASRCAAQAPQDIREPDSANSFSLLASDGHLVPLERKPVSVVAAKYEECFVGGRSAYQVQGEHSTVRRPGSLSLSIVVRLENQDIDPATPVILYPLKVMEGQRQSPSWCGGAFAGRRVKINRTVQIDITRYGEKSVKITPHGPLAPGEYAIMTQTLDNRPLFYCFGIDEAK